ncbi:MAG: NifU family protein [Myxococcota bacterium]
MAVRSTLRRIGSGLRRRVEARFGRGVEHPGADTPIAAPPARAPEPVAPVVPAAPAGPPPLTMAEVEVLLEDMVRPALQSDGGDITLIKVENNDVYVALRGACETCPSSIVTMQDGIARLLAEEFPQFGQLVRVDG